MNVDLSFGNLTTLQGLTRDCAARVRCRNNQLITLQGLEHATALQALYVQYNHLITLQGLERATALLVLNVDNNQLTTLQGLENATALQRLYVDDNQLTTLQGLEHATALQVLFVQNNRLITLQGLERATALQRLYVDNNPKLHFEHIRVTNTSEWRALCIFIHREFVTKTLALWKNIPPYVCLDILQFAVPDARHWLHKSKIELILSVYASCRSVCRWKGFGAVSKKV